MYLVANRASPRLKSDFSDVDLAGVLSLCSHIDEFSMYRVCGLKLTTYELRIMDQAADKTKVGKDSIFKTKELHEFAIAVKKKNEKLHSFGENIAELHRAVIKEDIKKVNKIVDSKIPREALFLIQGYSIPNFKVNVVSLLHEVEIDTAPMNIVELACVVG